MTVVDSAITDNSALSVGGIGNSGTLTLTNTSVIANRSLSSCGGGIYNDGGTATINPPAAVTGNTPDDCCSC
jgi:hypothetical protein